MSFQTDELLALRAEVEQLTRDRTLSRAEIDRWSERVKLVEARVWAARMILEGKADDLLETVIRRG